MIHLFLCLALLVGTLLIAMPLAIPAFAAIALKAFRPPASLLVTPAPRSIFDTRRMGLA